MTYTGSTKSKNITLSIVGGAKFFLTIMLCISAIVKRRKRLAFPHVLIVAQPFAILKVQKNESGYVGKLVLHILIQSFYDFHLAFHRIFAKNPVCLMLPARNFRFFFCWEIE